MAILRWGFAFALSIAGPVLAQPTTADKRASEGPRLDHALGVYDPRLQRVLLIGAAGDPAPGQRDQVWGWTGSRWEFVSDGGPPGRVNAAAAYDAGRGKVIVSGGSRKTSKESGWEVVGDSWAGDRSGWRRIADIEPRDHQSLVENGRGDVLMFGGIPPPRSGPWPNDTWELRGETWQRLATEGPVGRARTAMVYDSKRQQVVLFGGASAPSGPDDRQVFLGDTWIWDGQRWRQAAEQGPPGRYAHGMVFDGGAGVVLLYSGTAAHRGAPLSDMWQWDGNRWTEIRLVGPTPGHRYQPVMVYDKARKKTVLYGGIGSAMDTWEWDGQRWFAVTR